MNFIRSLRKSSKRFHYYFEKDIRTLFILSSIFYLSGFFLDLIFNFNNYGELLLIVDLLIISVISVSFYLGLKGKISVQLSYMISIYFSIVGLAFLYAYQLLSNTFKPFILFQDMLAIPLTIISMGLIISKRHLVFTGIIYSIMYPSIMIYSGNPNLIDSALFVFVLIIGPTFALAYIINSVELSLEERKKIEDDVARQRNELKKLNEEKNKLFSLIAHDLRGPLGNAINMLSLALDSPLTKTEKNEILHALHRSLDKTFNLLMNLLDWSTNEQGFFKYSPQNLKLIKVANETIDFLKTNAKQKKIEIHNNIPQNMITYSDKKLLGAIFRNLLSNAVKFSEITGKIIISADYYDDSIRVKIEDNGIGIEKEKLERIFLDDLSKTTLGTKSEIGYGFGLSLVRDFVEKNGGKIWAESEVGKGTTFYFTVPLKSV